MKTLIIMSRTVTERSVKGGYFKPVEQVSIFYNGKEYSNHYEDVNNPRLRNKFKVVTKTRKKQDVLNIISILGKSDVAKWKRSTLSEILMEVK